MAKENESKRRKKRPPKKAPSKAVAAKKKKAPPKRAKAAKASIEPPPPDPDNREYLRYAAGLYYEQDLNGCSVQQLSETDPFSKIPYATLRRWSEKDRWGERRTDWRQRLTDMAGEKVATELAQARIDFLKEAERQSDRTLQVLTYADPKSYEGVLSSWVKLQEFAEQMRGKVAAEVTTGPVIGTSSSGHQIQPVLTPEEAREAALAIVKKRQAQIRQEIAEAKKEMGEKPKLRMIEGKKGG